LIAYFENPTANIESRLKSSIQGHHSSNRDNGLSIQKKVDEKVKKFGGNTFLYELETLSQMFSNGHLTEEEFTTAKSKILSDDRPSFTPSST